MTEIDKIKNRLAEIESERKHLLERLSILEKL
jgi:hypothetical protein